MLRPPATLRVAMRTGISDAGGRIYKLITLFERAYFFFFRLKVVYFGVKKVQEFKNTFTGIKRKTYASEILRKNSYYNPDNLISTTFN